MVSSRPSRSYTSSRPSCSTWSPAGPCNPPSQGASRVPEGVARLPVGSVVRHSTVFGITWTPLQSSSIPGPLQRAHLRQILVDEPHCHRTLAHGRSHPLDRPAAHIAHGEDAGQSALEVSLAPSARPSLVSDRAQATPRHTATRAPCSNPTTTMVRGTRYR